MKKMNELSYKRRLTRLFKYLKDTPLDGFDIQIVKQIELPASHAVILGIATKKTMIVLGIGANEEDLKYVVSFQWVHTDHYVQKQDEGLVNVVLELFSKDPKKCKRLAIKSFNLEGNKIKDIKSETKEYSIFLDKYIKLATDLLWDTPNSIRFIKED